MSLAAMVLAGKGAERDPDAAVALYEKAADNGSPLACDYLGWLFMTGETVPADPEKE